jgi:tRNA(fMet)-specific endonuclease VapC
MRGNPKAVARMAALAPQDCAVSVISAYELLTGVAKCGQPQRERAKVQRLLSAVSVLVFDESAAEHAGQVRADLERAGKVSGPYDMLLAGHALSLKLSLATNNVAEFSRVSGLTLDDWLA